MRKVKWKNTVEKITPGLWSLTAGSIQQIRFSNGFLRYKIVGLDVFCFFSKKELKEWGQVTIFFYTASPQNTTLRSTLKNQRFLKAF
jgi:hypothetical protein